MVALNQAELPHVKNLNLMAFASTMVRLFDRQQIFAEVLPDVNSAKQMRMDGLSFLYRDAQ